MDSLDLYSAIARSCAITALVLLSLESFALAIYTATKEDNDPPHVTAIGRVIRMIWGRR